MIVNRTGAGYHADSRREVRFDRHASQRWAIEESLAADVAADVDDEGNSPVSDDT